MVVFEAFASVAVHASSLVASPDFVSDGFGEWPSLPLRRRLHEWFAAAELPAGDEESDSDECERLPVAFGDEDEGDDYHAGADEGWVAGHRAILAGGLCGHGCCGGDE